MVKHHRKSRCLTRFGIPTGAIVKANGKVSRMVVPEQELQELEALAHRRIAAGLHLLNGHGTPKEGSDEGGCLALVSFTQSTIWEWIVHRKPNLRASGFWDRAANPLAPVFQSHSFKIFAGRHRKRVVDPFQGWYFQFPRPEGDFLLDKTAKLGRLGRVIFGNFSKFGWGFPVRKRPGA